ncbi:hypothetical protein ACFPME_14305 [Rhodanobacter umsongensis]|uniref:Tol-pal system protein YbgF n=1 Tax=Rhodanobacter umsongensis TaxID=633153 RepID=A0ABW0JPF4_9GAMM
MRCLQLIGLAGFIVASAVWARPGPSEPERVVSAAPLPSALHQSVARHRAEVRRLERDLARQESDSKQASRRLQQQDQAIAELQKQLHELQVAAPADRH